MNNDIAVLESREILGRTFCIYGTAEEPLFLAKDVAEWIEHSNARMMLQSIDDEEKRKHEHPVNNPYGVSQTEEQWFLTEDGLYEVLMQSRKPIARQFKTEVKAILKSIRRHGAYMTPTTVERVLADPDLLIRLATELRDSRREVERLRNVNRSIAEWSAPRWERQKRRHFGWDVAIGHALTFPTNTFAVVRTLRADGIRVSMQQITRFLRNQGWWRYNDARRHVVTPYGAATGYFIAVTLEYNGESVRITQKGFNYLLGVWRDAMLPFPEQK